LSGWWAYLEERTRREVDAEVLRDNRMTALKAVWEAPRPLGLGLHEAEQVVHRPYQALGERVQRRPPDSLDIPSLVARAATLPGRVAAIEALWDGDTVHNWFVLLVAVLDEPAGEGHLATVYPALTAPLRAPPPPRPAEPWPSTSTNARSIALAPPSGPRR